MVIHNSWPWRSLCRGCRLRTWFQMQFATIELVTCNWHARHSLIEPRPGLRKAFLFQKAELTEYLAVKCLTYRKFPVSKLKKFHVTSGTETKGNTSISDVLLTHSQAGADTLLILHALTADKDAELVIDSPDADVPILLIKGCQLLRVFSQGRGIWGEILQFNLFVKSLEKSAPLWWLTSMLSQEVICQGDLLAGARRGASWYSWNMIARY